ncbi:MAG: hypothetical protein ACI865_002964 [Flavobacteriaceae bacterium]|jgi:hypothetical protein
MTIFPLGGLVVYLFLCSFFTYFLIKLRRMLHRRGQTIRGVQLCLNVLPIINLVTSFIVLPKLSKALKRQFEGDTMFEEDGFGKVLGQWLSVLHLFSVFFLILLLLGIHFGAIQRSLSSCSWLGTIVIFIVYWARMERYRVRLFLDDDEKRFRSSVLGSEDLLDS